MAGAGFRTFVAGEVLTAAQVNTYLMEQAVMTFADSAARDAAITSPTEGMVCYLADTNYVQIYDGSAWNDVLTAAGVASTRQERVEYTAAGVDTFVKASYSWAKYATITVVGGGGAGGGNTSTTAGEGSVGAGGGGGGWAIKTVEVSTLAASETVTVGAGGTGVSAADGNDGTGSSFGTLVVAGPGLGGDHLYSAGPIYGDTAYGGDGGIGTAGDDLGKGQAGFFGYLFETVNPTVIGWLGGGGQSLFGGNNESLGNYQGVSGFLVHTGQAGLVPGAGGQGSGGINFAANQPGGAGADGIVIVELSS